MKTNFGADRLVCHNFLDTRLMSDDGARTRTQLPSRHGGSRTQIKVGRARQRLICQSDVGALFGALDEHVEARFRRPPPLSLSLCEVISINWTGWLLGWDAVWRAGNDTHAAHPPYINVDGTELARYLTRTSNSAICSCRARQFMIRALTTDDERMETNGPERDQS